MAYRGILSHIFCTGAEYVEVNEVVSGGYMSISPYIKMSFESQRVCVPIGVAESNSIDDVLEVAQKSVYFDLSKYNELPQTFTRMYHIPVYADFFTNAEKKQLTIDDEIAKALKKVLVVIE